MGSKKKMQMMEVENERRNQTTMNKHDMNNKKCIVWKKTELCVLQAYDVIYLADKWNMTYNNITYLSWPPPHSKGKKSNQNQLIAILCETWNILSISND